MTRVCIHQPDFLPYLGFFDRLLDSDTFIILDDAQFVRGGWNNRDKIKTRKGATWLTLSIERGTFPQPINEVRLDRKREGWVESNLNLITENYREAADFTRHFEDVAAIYRRGYDRLVDLNMALIDLLLGIFDISIDLKFSSQLGIPGKGTDRLVSLVKAVGGSNYISGVGALQYLDRDAFVRAGIALEIQDFRHPEYPQLHGPFIPFLSSLDVILNCGARSRDIVRSCRAEAVT